MNPKQKTQSKIENIKKLSDEERAEIHRILNEFISKNRSKHYRILSKRLNKAFKFGIDDETVEDNLQNIYIYMYLNPNTVKSFNETGCLNRLFTSLAYNISVIGNISKKYCRELPLMENADFEYEEDEQQWTTDNLSHELSNEQRLEAHRIALDELKSYLIDNPQSNLKKALELTKNDKVDSVYNVALNFVATPSYAFLYKNREELGLRNIQNNLNRFKKICEKVYNKKVVWNAQFPWSGF